MSSGRRGELSGRRFNTLIVGARPDIERALADLGSDFHEREYRWPDRPEPTADAPSTLVVREVGALAAPELDALNELIARAGRHVHVVSTSSGPLWQAVEVGRFPADLYYRLNCVLIDASRRPGAGFAILSLHEELQQSHRSARPSARSGRVEDRRRADD
jgi:hypothetical protein